MSVFHAFASNLPAGCTIRDIDGRRGENYDVVRCKWCGRALNDDEIGAEICEDCQEQQKEENMSDESLNNFRGTETMSETTRETGTRIARNYLSDWPQNSYMPLAYDIIEALEQRDREIERLKASLVHYAGSLNDAKEAMRFALQHGAVEYDGACGECGEPCSENMQHEKLCWVGKLRMALDGCNEMLEQRDQLKADFVETVKALEMLVNQSRMSIEKYMQGIEDARALVERLKGEKP